MKIYATLKNEEKVQEMRNKMTELETQKMKELEEAYARFSLIMYPQKPQSRNF